MNKKGWVGIFLVFLFLFIFMGFIIFKTVKTSPANSAYSIESPNNPPIDSSEPSCFMDEDCFDNNPCTIDLCSEEACTGRDVVLCYMNDGCCPQGCTPSNDNDCLS